jgi:flagellar biosynthesis protein FlhF
LERNKPPQVADSHPCYEILLANGFNPRTASELIVEAESSSNCATPNPAVDLDTEKLISCVANTLNTTQGLLGNSIARHSIAFAGPPGAGKTSVLVKLASLAVRQMDLSVGLVTFDCFRQGGVDQLLYFAEQLETPLEIVDDAARVSATMSRLQEYDLVLIDTPGFPARADASLASLQAMLEAAEPDALCLVLDACRSPGCVEECFRGYQCLKPSHVIVSKLDEAVQFGSLYSPLRSSLLPISYLTNGQNVSSDIQEANPDMLARLMLGSDALNPPLNKKKKQAA